MMTLNESRFIGMSRMGKHLGLSPLVMLSAEFWNEILHAVYPERSERVQNDIYGSFLHSIINIITSLYLVTAFVV